MKRQWKKRIFIIVVVGISFLLIRNKYFYNRLFSEEFCDSIIEVHYITYENEVYRITDEKVVKEFADALYSNKYKKLPAVNEGGYHFKLIMEDETYTICMTASDIQWKGKGYETKEDFFEILEEVWKCIENKRTDKEEWADEVYVEGSEWGIDLQVMNVTAAGLTLACTQSGGSYSRELQTGSMDDTRK